MQQIKVDCARDTERELASSRQRLKAKDAELCGAQQQLAELQAELKQLAHKKEVSSTCLAILANVSYEFQILSPWHIFLKSV